MNVVLRKFQEEMVDLINSAQLPVEAKRLVVCEVLHKLEIETNRAIAYEIQEENKQAESEETKGE
jgi:hypothetical protein